ncbi:MAG: hypothetical protein EOO63_02150 [Hymenobacter sp.]|nr:MAG: hypothetical protein EOO63_02150 [Hymenobacter sp.]
MRKVTPAGVVSTLAGRGTAGYLDGPAATAAFNYPIGVAVAGQGTVYVADYNNNCIRAISPAGVVSTWAGTTAPGLQDGPAATARSGSLRVWPATSRADCMWPTRATSVSARLAPRVW